MLITSIKISRSENSATKMKGVVTIILDEMIAIKEIKILYADNKYFLAMPSRPTKVGTFKDMVHPISADVRNVFETLIISGYKRAESDGYSKIEFSLQNSEKKSLLEQNIDDFSVKGHKGGFVDEFLVQVSIDKDISAELIASKSKKQDINDSLLKWLES